VSEDEVPFWDIRQSSGPLRDFSFVAIIDHEWGLENEGTFKFDNDLELGPFPKEYRGASPGVVLGPIEQGHIEDCQYAFQVRYQYHAVGGYIPGDAYQRYSLAALSLWIATESLPAPPIPLNVTFERDKDGWHAVQASLRSGVVYRRHPSDPRPTHFPNGALSEAREIYTDLRTSLKSDDQVRAVIYMIHQALASDQWALRFATLWIVMESLVGNAESGAGVTGTIARRVSDFLKDGSISRTKLSKRVRQNYRWRCWIVHGLHHAVKDTLERTAEDVTKEVEGWIRRSLRRIFFEREPDDLLEIFNDPVRRTRYLDDLRPPRAICPECLLPHR
jgi:hypothetical protein